MAKPKVGSLEHRKKQLAMESDTLRYQLGWQCAELAVPASVAVQGIQIAQRVAPLFVGNKKRDGSKRSMWLRLAQTGWRLFGP